MYWTMTVLTASIFLLLTLTDCSASSKLIEKAVSIVSTYYQHNFATTVVWKYNESSYVDGFLKKYPGSVILKPLYNAYDSKIRYFKKEIGFRQTIFFATTLQEYEKFMKIMYKIIRDPIRFILVLEMTVEEPSELSRFIEVSWTNDQGDMVIISANDADVITLSTFFPYSYGSCENYTPVILKDSDNVFPKKFRNFHRCPVRANVLHYMPFSKIVINNDSISVGGYDGQIVQMILDKINATIDVNLADHYGIIGNPYGNGTASGCMTDLLAKKVDIIIPGAVMTSRRYPVTPLAHNHHQLVFRWVGPKRREMIDWVQVIVPDKRNITYFHGLALVSFIFVVKLIIKFKPHTTIRDGIFFLSFIILLGQSGNFLTRSSLLNSVFTLWIWFCLIIRINYEGDLFESLQRPTLESPFKSLDDAVAKLDGYGGTDVFYDMFEGTHVESKFKRIPLVNVIEYLQRVFNGERFLVASDMTLVQDVRDFQIVGNIVTSNGICFLMRPGWPAVKTVDHIIISLVETGLAEHVVKRSDPETKLKRNIDTDDDSKVKVLNMARLCSRFYGLAIMWGVCSIVLVLEILYYKYSLRLH